jgi:hypothetical protein
MRCHGTEKHSVFVPPRTATDMMVEMKRTMASATSQPGNFIQNFNSLPP